MKGRAANAGRRGIRFEARRGKVSGYCASTAEAVVFIEGCT